MLFGLDEQPGVPMEDAREVSCYVAALERGLKRLRRGFPLSQGLLRKVHQLLMTRRGQRGAWCQAHALQVPIEPGLDRRYELRQRRVRAAPGQ